MILAYAQNLAAVDDDYLTPVLPPNFLIFQAPFIIVRNLLLTLVQVGSELLLVESRHGSALLVILRAFFLVPTIIRIQYVPVIFTDVRDLGKMETEAGRDLDKTETEAGMIAVRREGGVGAPLITTENPRKYIDIGLGIRLSGR